MRQIEKSHSRAYRTFVPKFDSFDNNNKQFIKFIINLNTVIMRIFTKSLLVLVMLCIAGVMSAKKVVVQEGVKKLVRTIDYGAGASYGWNQCPSGASLAVQDGCLVIDNTSTDGDFYSFQFFAFDGVPYQAGSTYELRITYKFVDGDDDANNNAVWLRLGGWDGTPTHYGVSLPASDEFTTKVETWENYYADVNGGLMWQSRGVLGTFYVKKFEIYEVNPKTIEYEWVEAANIGEPYKKVYPATDPEKVTNQEIVIDCPALVSYGWDTQFWVRSKQILPAGTPFKLTFDCKASSNQSIESQSHEEPGNYLGGAFGNVNVTTEWQPFETIFVVPANCDGSERQNATYKNEFKSIAFNLTKDADVTYYFKNIKLILDKDDLDPTLHPDYRPETAVNVDVEINDTDPAIVSNKVALLSAINRGKNADRTNKTVASMKALDDAIEAAYKLFAPEAQKKTVVVTTPGGVVKKELTFSTAEYCAASWDAATSTMTWGTGGWDPSFTFMTADDIKGDVTEWTKLHLNVSDFTNSAENKLKIKFKEDNGAWPPSGPETDFIEAPDADGNINIDLAAATWNTDRTKLADLTIYGMDRTDATATGSVKVNEAWLEKTTEDKVEEQVVDMSREEIVANLSAAAQAIRAAIVDLEDRPAPIAELEVPAGWKSVIINGTLEGSDMSCFFSKDNSSDPYTSVAVDYEGKDGHKAIVLQTGGSKAGTDWEDQFFIRATESIPAGKKFHVEFDYRSDIDASGDTQCHEQPGNYIHWSCINSPSFKSDWQHYTFEGTVPSQCDGKPNDSNTFMKNFQTIAFNLSKTRKDVKFVFDNIQFWVEDAVTEIKSVETKAEKNEYYDLQGRRVAQPGKGLYILNGKKVLK